MGLHWLAHGGTGLIWGGTGWYLVVLGHFILVLLGIKCIYIYKYILKQVEIWSGATDP